MSRWYTRPNWRCSQEKYWLRFLLQYIWHIGNHLGQTRQHLVSITNVLKHRSLAPQLYFVQPCYSNQIFGCSIHQGNLNIVRHSPPDLSCCQYAKSSMLYECLRSAPNVLGIMNQCILCKLIESHFVTVWMLWFIHFLYLSASYLILSSALILSYP